MREETEPPFVLVHVPPVSTEVDRSLPELVESLRTEAVDGVVLDLFRTSRLISRIHCPDEAKQYDNRQLDRDHFIDLHQRFDNEHFDVVGRPHDPELVEWYAEQTTASSLQIHPGDITYKRLLETVAEFPLEVILGIKATNRSTVDRALKWIGNAKDVLLLHEEYDSEERRPDRYRALAEWGTRKGLADPSGDSDRTRSILSKSEGVPSLWQPRLSLGEQSPGYTAESIGALAAELKESTPESPKPPKSPAINDRTWSLTDRDRSYQQTWRRSLMADRHLSAGSTLKPEMVRELRPGNGLPAEEIDSLKGILIQRPTEPQEMISY